jgi:hypothetical protein
MWGNDTKVSKENTGPSSASTSVGEILYATARAFPVANPFPIGESLMQVILSPQEAADFLYFLMNVISMESARMITPSTEPTSFSTVAAWTNVMAPGTADALEERYRDSHFKGKITKEWTKAVYEQKIEEIREKLTVLTQVQSTISSAL